MTQFDKLKQSLTVKLMAIGFLTLLLMIPLGMVSSLVSERASNKDNVSNQIFADWSRSQTLKGPILSIPYYAYYAIDDTKNSKGPLSSNKRMEKRIEYIHFLPDELKVDGTVVPFIRYRSIYEAVVYKSDLKVYGTFSRPDLSEWAIDKKDILYDKALLSFGLSDLRGVQERIKIKFDNKSFFFDPGIKLGELSKVITSGVSVPLHYDTKKASVSFEFALKLNGSESLFFLPYGKETDVKLKSSWSNPSFMGDFLPDDRTVTKEGFTARWKVVDINRAYPQNFKGSDVQNLKHNNEYHRMGKYDDRYDSQRYPSSSFGVNLRVPVDYYQKSKRSVKYGALIIILTFIALFFVEIFLKKRIHGFQYILIGTALVIFFALLISLSEHIGFDSAYAVSTLATITLITLYVKSLFKHFKFVMMLLGILLIYYGFIYILLQLQDYSLLLGVIMLFMTLASIMYISKDIDWYEIKTEGQTS